MALTRFTFGIVPMALFVCAFSVLLSQPLAQAQEDSPQPVIKNMTQWKAALRAYNKSFVIVDGKAYANPYYDPKFPNSNHTNTSQWTKENTKKLEFEGGPRMVGINPEKLVPPKEEVLAQSKALQGFDPGHYGYIESATVAEKIGENGLILKNIILTDAEDYAKAQQKDQAALNKWEEEIAEQIRDENTGRWGQRKAYKRGPSRSQRKQAAKTIMDVRYKERSKLIHLQDSMKDKGVILLDVPNKVYQVGSAFKKRSLLQWVIVDFDQERGMPVAIPATSFKSGLSEQELLGILQDQQVKPDSFAELVALLKDKDPLESRLQILSDLGFDGYSNEPGGQGKILGSTSVGGVSNEGKPRDLSQEDWEKLKEERKKWRQKWRERNKNKE